jgi:hypothetical protein
LSEEKTVKALTASILVLGALMFFTLSAHAGELPAFKQAWTRLEPARLS